MKTQITKQLKLPFLFVQKLAQVVRSALSRLSRPIQNFRSRPICAVRGCSNPNSLWDNHNFYPCSRCGRDVFTGDSLREWLDRADFDDDVRLSDGGYSQ